MHLSNLVRQFFFFALLALSGAVFTPAVGAVVHRTDAGGELRGASGIVVAGHTGTFSVEFVDGTCASVFGECVQRSFVFKEYIAAWAAADALLSQVLIDTPAGDFDHDLSRIAGCEDDYLCVVFTPYFSYEPYVDFSYVHNSRFESGDPINANDYTYILTLPTSVDTSGSEGNSAVWAVWSKDGANGEINEPGTLILSILSGGLLMLSQRSRRMRY